MVLSRILESSGLRQGEEFITQAAFTDEEGQRRQPDVLVKLPDERHIVVDSKVSLKAYEALISEEDEEKRQKLLQSHTQSVSQHVKGLGGKHYAELEGMRSPGLCIVIYACRSSI